MRCALLAAGPSVRQQRVNIVKPKQRKRDRRSRFTAARFPADSGRRLYRLRPKLDFSFASAFLSLVAEHFKGLFRAGGLQLCEGSKNTTSRAVFRRVLW